ncbi:hypothetical protein EHM69_07040 [candidate division KSB1 bacterium]|nr:MAG: hypothetical protein EHM69_07040 [candidate division KSB1 bacterium]
MKNHRAKIEDRIRIPWETLGESTRMFSWKFFTVIFAFEVFLSLLNVTGTPSVTINRLINIDGESNLPTWFSSAQLLLLSLTTLLAWKLDTDVGWKRAGWLMLTLLFGYLSIDETATIHESFGAAATKQFQWTLWGEYYWMLLFAPFACVGLVLLIQVFWQKLRTDTRAFFLASAGILAWISTLVIETIGHWLMGHELDDTFVYRGFVITEELCEMAGATLFWMAVVCWVQFRSKSSRQVAA